MVLNRVPFDDAIPRTCLVLNGRGFLGRSPVLRLLRLDNWIVRVADSAQSIQLAPLRFSLSGRAEYHQVDVRDIYQIKKALEGSCVMFYMDATDLNTNDFCSCYMIVVQGAKNVITACRECKVRRLIYNSTADVVFDGSHDIHNGDETLTCCWKFQDMICDPKAQAEALVLFANNIDGFLTCALRPSNVFGTGESSKIWLDKGSGENMSDFTYVENVTHAHICAVGALDSRMVSVVGKIRIYHIGKLGISKLITLFNQPHAPEPLTALLHKNILVTHQLSLWKDFNGQSKVDKLLGGGKVADILLWRDEKKTFTYFLAMVLFFYWFFLCRRTFTSSAAKLILLVAIVLSGYGILPANIFGFNVRSISLSCFEISETVIKDTIATIASLWNMGFWNIRSLAKGDDWNNFFKVAVSLHLFKLLLPSITSVTGVALIFASTAFFFHEQYESEIDGAAKYLFNHIKISKEFLTRNLPTPVVSFLLNYEILHEHTAPAEVKDRKLLE